jgi:hypothetical protein
MGCFEITKHYYRNLFGGGRFLFLEAGNPNRLHSQASVNP